MYSIGIVGHEAAKFTPSTEAAARMAIRSLLSPGRTGRAELPVLRLVSGGCHLGGVDIWAEEIADELGIQKLIHFPKTQAWTGGYKDRNKLIAEHSDIVHVIVVKKLPDTYQGMRFPLCYHCRTDHHVKSGGCWTGHRALKLGKEAIWHELG